MRLRLARLGKELESGSRWLLLNTALLLGCILALGPRELQRRASACASSLQVGERLMARTRAANGDARLQDAPALRRRRASSDRSGSRRHTDRGSRWHSSIGIRRGRSWSRRRRKRRRGSLGAKRILMGGDDVDELPKAIIVSRGSTIRVDCNAPQAITHIPHTCCTCLRGGDGCVLFALEVRIVHRCLREDCLEIMQ